MVTLKAKFADLRFTHISAAIHSPRISKAVDFKASWDKFEYSICYMICCHDLLPFWKFCHLLTLTLRTEFWKSSRSRALIKTLSNISLLSLKDSENEAFVVRPTSRNPVARSSSISTGAAAALVYVGHHPVYQHENSFRLLGKQEEK